MSKVLTCQAKGKHESCGGYVDAYAHYVNSHLWLRQSASQQDDGLKAPPLHTYHCLYKNTQGLRTQPLWHQAGHGRTDNNTLLVWQACTSLASTACSHDCECQDVGNNQHYMGAMWAHMARLML